MTSIPEWNEVSARFYEAEELWLEDVMDDELSREDVAGFIADVLARSGFSTDDRPSIVWDIPDDSNLSGRFDATDGALHLHPRLTRKSLIVHELAHWIDPRPWDGQGHGAVFLDTYTTLIIPVFGEDAAEDLRACVREVAG